MKEIVGIIFMICFLTFGISMCMIDKEVQSNVSYKRDRIDHRVARYTFDNGDICYVYAGESMQCRFGKQ